MAFIEVFMGGILQVEKRAKNTSTDCNYDNDYYGDRLCHHIK
ncbi:hypothetical protein [Bacterioplanes sanyensis]|nr:hypothetical protein [Bacterioplanes sanyensis]